MSSIMRCRSGETLGVNELMVRLQLMSEADRLAHQLGRTSGITNNLDFARSEYRESGLVHRPGADADERPLSGEL
jgi:hypothetical protein